MNIKIINGKVQILKIAQTKTEPKISKITLIVPLIILFILAVSVKSLLNLVIIFPLGVIS